jgi:hypothetical protein
MSHDGGGGGGFGESAASLTFLDPDEDVGIDTQAEDFRFNFTLPSQDFGGDHGGVSMSGSSLDDQLQDGIKMVN